MFEYNKALPTHLKSTIQEVKMKYIKSMLIILLCFLILAPLCIKADAVTKSQTETIKARADSYLKSLYDKNEFSGTVLIVKDNNIIFHGNYGMADYELSSPVTDKTKFRIGSITKQFTAAAVMQLQEQGKLNVADKLSKYVPYYPNGNNITLHNLLTHTSGIADYLVDPAFLKEASRAHTPMQLIDFFKNKPVWFEPSKSYAYSNSNYVLLGYIIEKVTGIKYEDYVMKNVVEKAGLKDTCFDRDNMIIQNRAKGYSPGISGKVNTSYIDPSCAYAAGGLYSTALDLNKWNDALSSGKIVSKASYQKMLKPYMPDAYDGSGYGYGLIIYNEKIGTLTKQVVEHTGEVNGFISYNESIPVDKLQIIMLSNFDYSAQVHNALECICYDQKYTETSLDQKKVKLNPDSYSFYTGKYIYPLMPDSQIEVQARGTELVACLGAPYNYTLELYPVYDGKDSTKFITKLPGVKCYFAKDSSGNITKASIVLNDIPQYTLTKAK